MSDISVGSTASGATRAPQPAAGYLFGPVIDFVCLGGGSLIFLFGLVLFAEPELRPSIVFAAIVVSHFVNNPHFMHSYQIFYENFLEKAFGETYSRTMRIRYVVAGIGVPLAMGLFFVYAVLTADPALLGLGANAMAFLVGWHYVKQGYGILIVESVLKRSFFNDSEKRWLRWNGFAVWWFSWIYANISLHESTTFGLRHYSFDLPDWLAALAGALMVTTTFIVLVLVARKRFVNGNRLPVNGLLAYASSGYVWLVAIHLEPLLVLLVPAFHSLQYLAVVWRYQLNKARADVGDQAPVEVLGGRLSISRPILRLLRFVVIGTCAGVVAFWVAPLILHLGVPYDRASFGPALFFFMAFVFINVHHYFLDNVMWRRENPDIKRHLFSAH